MEKVQNIEVVFKFFTFLLLSPHSSFKKAELYEAIQRFEETQQKDANDFLQKIIDLGLIKRVDRINYAISQDGFQLWMDIIEQIKLDAYMNEGKSAWVKEVLNIIDSKPIP